MPAKMYDIAILGANPAGYTAAMQLAKAKLSVLVLKAPAVGALNCPLCDWVPKSFFPLSVLPKSLAKAAKAVKFQAVQYHDVDMKRVVEHKSRGTLGHFIPAGALDKALHDAAVKAGVIVRTSKTAPAIRLIEDHVELVGSRPYNAQLLLVAQDHPSHILSDLGQPARVNMADPMNVVALDIPLTPSQKKTLSHTLSGAMHVFELSERSELGMAFVAESILHVRVISTSRAAGVRTVELTTLLKSMQSACLLPSDLSLGKAKGAAWHPTAGLALEQEIHEAKRTLLAGSAGGFADSVTGHTLYPSVISTVLAADIAKKALKSDTPQDTLMEFKQQWRTKLVDYLRPPNTSLAMLLPLLFVNKKIVAQFTHAMLEGKDI